ncbi:MAG TPA: hypothetical protein VMK12_24030, partial [Anaeromyxobacteraceae bacterium]|nr:hypothetical protein [Anaeromyxobacteraceae bacterium]
MNRLRQIIQIAARHGFGAYFDQTHLGELLGSREAAEVGQTPSAEGAPAPGQRIAHRFRQLL